MGLGKVKINLDLEGFLLLSETTCFSLRRNLKNYIGLSLRSNMKIILRPGTTLVLVLGVSAWPKEPVVLRRRKRIQKIEIGNVGQACCGVARAVSVAALLTLLLNFCKQKKVERSKRGKVKKLKAQKFERSKHASPFLTRV